ncbi:hypothetical protein [Lachnospira pectinoschiza]|uniref:hypothetical protein n=1 Tax=Lachnospira pectinoschiza TaxID=28052 RepID=UPI0015D66E34|nr:hypothetical protein [Lachnospira pectinoschiza]
MSAPVIFCVRAIIVLKIHCKPKYPKLFTPVPENPKRIIKIVLLQIVHQKIERK